jgi:hypothetical protein
LLAASGTVVRSRLNLILARRLLVVILCLSGAACTSGDIESRELVDTAESSIREGIECRSSVSGTPEYRSLAQHMPLVDVNEATLTQMTDTRATRTDYYVIADWQRDIGACRTRLLEVIEPTNRSMSRSSSPDETTTTKSWSCSRSASSPGAKR